MVPTIEEFQSSTLKSSFKVLLFPIWLPYKLLGTVLLLPFSIMIEFFDSIIALTLRKLKMSKGDAKEYMKSIAKNQFFRLRTLCLIFVIILSIFSIALGFSATVYTGLYVMMIPIGTQNEMVFFK